MTKVEDQDIKKSEPDQPKDYFVNPFNHKEIPTFLSTKEVTMSTIRKQVESYLCDYCCSHRITKFPSTLSNSFDIVQCFVGN